ncbi:hypothetical protein [Sphingobium chungangianum]
MTQRDRPATRLWLILAIVAAALILTLLAAQLISGEWLWIILNGLLQHELG